MFSIFALAFFAWVPIVKTLVIKDSSSCEAHRSCLQNDVCSLFTAPTSLWTVLLSSGFKASPTNRMFSSATLGVLSYVPSLDSALDFACLASRVDDATLDELPDELPDSDVVPLLDEELSLLELEESLSPPVSLVVDE